MDGFGGLKGWSVGWVGWLTPGILIIVHQVRLVMSSAIRVDQSVTFLLSFSFFLWEPSFMLKSYGVGCGGGWVAYRILVSAPVPFWAFCVWGLKGLGTFCFLGIGVGNLRVWGIGLDDSHITNLTIFSLQVSDNGLGARVYGERNVLETLRRHTLDGDLR